MDTLDNTQAHCAQLHTNDKNRAEAYADRMQSLGYRVTTSSDYSPTKRGTVYTVTVTKPADVEPPSWWAICESTTIRRVTLAPLINL